MKPTQFKQLDVRPILERGDEPFSAIRRTVDGLKTGEGLRLLAPFLPSPLIDLLKGEGFQTRFERGRDGAWVVYFWREPGLGSQ